MEAVGDNPRSSSEAVAPRNRKGFSLVEAAIVLGVVGFVLGGIWYAAANVMENYRVNKIVEGSAFYFASAANFIRERRIPVTTMSSNLAAAVGLVPEDWRESVKTGGIKIGVVSVSCCGISSIVGGPQYEATGLSYVVKLSDSRVCQKLLVKLTQAIWPQIVGISVFSSGGALSYPFGGSSGAPTLLTGPITPTHSGLNTICTTNSFGLGAAMVQIFYGVYR